MDDDTRNPYFVRCSPHTNVPGGTNAISRPLGGAYGITMNTGLTGMEVAGLLILLAQLFQELDDSDEKRKNPLHHMQIVKTISELSENLKELVNTEGGKADSVDRKRLSEYIEELFKNIHKGVNVNDPQLERLGRQLGSTLVSELGATNALKKKNDSKSYRRHVTV